MELEIMELLNQSNWMVWRTSAFVVESDTSQKKRAVKRCEGPRWRNHAIELKGVVDGAHFPWGGKIRIKRLRGNSTTLPKVGFYEVIFYGIARDPFSPDHLSPQSLIAQADGALLLAR